MSRARLSAHELYTAASFRAAAEIIAAYSTSFSAASALLGRRHRPHVRNIYALVRVADELVDGVTAEVGFDADLQRAALDQLETETERAINTGYSSNPIVHAFAHTAQLSHIGPDLTRPFFASMRTDLGADGQAVQFGEQAHADYVFGSAEVVGLMCLQVFVRDENYSAQELTSLRHGARRLGAAFQNVNFLRDLADDTGRLGRSYLGTQGQLNQQQLQEWVGIIRQQLAEAARTVPLLPRDARMAVGCALRLFSRLTSKIAATPAPDLYRRRIRVAGPEKMLLIAQSTRDLRKASAA